jgi:hypothetical protein
MRSHHGYNYHLLLLSLLISLATFTAVQVAGSDILNQGSNITDGETLVSANGTFTLGFFAPGAPTRRYLGIWLTVTNSSDAVWVANRDHPLVDASGVLVLRDTGSLALLDGKTQTAWSSNTVGAVSPTLQLLESGNLVVRDGRSGGGILWQSFDHPTNTLVPGMKIGRNLWTDTEWYLQSWKSANDPSPGTLRYVVVTRGGGPPQIAMVDSSGATRFRTGVWNGLWFSGIPEMASYANEFAYQMTVSPGEVTYGYAARPGAPLSRLVLNDSGVVERLGWDPGSRAWNNFFQGPRDVCDKYDMCGPSGVCNASAAATSFCSCVVGFSPVSQTAWSMRGRSSGCRRNVPLDCGGDGESAGSTDWFAVLPGVKLPDMVDSWSLDTSVTLDECRARCLANCSCVAYAAADIRGGGDGTGCLMWAENLIDLRYVDGGQTLYLRQARPVSGMNTSTIVSIQRFTTSILVTRVLIFFRRKLKLVSQFLISNKFLIIKKIIFWEHFPKEYHFN